MIIHIRAPKNAAYVLVTPVYDGEWSSSYVSTAAGLDSEHSNDKGAFSDMDNELAEISSGVYSLDITAAEMNADLVVVKMTSTTAGANIPLHVIHTFTEPLDDTNVELASIPTTTGGLRTMIQFLFQYFRNARTETTATESLKKEDGSTELGSRTLADDGSTFTRGEMS